MLLFSRWQTAAILDFDLRMTPKLKFNHFIVFGMLELVETDTSFVLLSNLEPEILNCMFSRWQTAAIFDFDLRMTPKLKINHFIVFVMVKLVGKDTSFVLLSNLEPEILNFMFLKMVSAAILNIAL